MSEEDEDYTIFIYPTGLDAGFVELLKKSVWALDHHLYAYTPGANKTRTALERAFEILEECEFMITILNPKSVNSALLNQFFGFAMSDEKQSITISVGGVKGMGMMSFSKTVQAGSGPEDIVSAVIWGIIEEDELDTFTFQCMKCREEDYSDLPSAGDMMKFQRSGTPFEVECESCDHVNLFNPKTLLPH